MQKKIWKKDRKWIGKKGKDNRMLCSEEEEVEWSGVDWCGRRSGARERGKNQHNFYSLP